MTLSCELVKKPNLQTTPCPKGHATRTPKKDYLETFQEISYPKNQKQ